ncbi:MAG: DUF1080 domain-containing protein [Phycisphaera sp.]|nr:DUF1080 domain-containing protein [Phycisphaera sp.]
MPRKQRLAIAVYVILATLCGTSAVLLAGGTAYTDPAVALKEDPDFAVQGEYVGEVTQDGSAQKWGAQVVALGEGKFFGVALVGGLPGDGWNGTDTHTALGERAADGSVVFPTDDSKAVIKDGVITTYDKNGSQTGTFKKVTRVSPTDGAKPPAGATVLFDGTEASLKNWVNGKLDGDTLCEGTNTAQKFGSFKLHLEFRLPFKPSAKPSSQDRGNSGIYTFNRYETQVLDAFGLHYNHDAEADWKARFTKELGFAPQSDRTQFTGSLYHWKTPDINVCYPPLVWQTYDITFTAPKFDAAGKKIANARFTTLHNGVKIHDDVEMVHGGTGAGGKKPEVATEGIYLQGHGNPVRYRNIWIQPLD